MKRILSLALCLCLFLCIFTACDKKEGHLSLYELQICYDDEAKKITGKMTFDFFNDTDNEIVDLHFNLYPNAYRKDSKFCPIPQNLQTKAYYNGKSYGDMQIIGVEGAQSWTIGGDDCNILIITLPTPIYPEERSKISIEYTVNLAQVNHRTGISQNAVSLCNIYPILCAYNKEGYLSYPYYQMGDPFVSQCANYKVEIQFPATYTAATSGKLTSSTLVGDTKKECYSLNNARDFAIILSEKFETCSQNVDGVEVTYYYTQDTSPQVSLSVACHSLKYFTQTFGDYAYPTYNLVESQFIQGGMEYPALSHIANIADSDERAYTIAHETAHQWWYAMVGSNQVESPWQDEGLAEYSALLFFENNPNYAFTRSALVDKAIKNYRAYYSVYNQIFGDVDTTMTRTLKDYSGDFEYTNIVYNKSMVMMDWMRDSMGDTPFLNGLKNYYKNNLFKIATSEDFISTMVNAGASQAFFDSFLEGKIII